MRCPICGKKVINVISNINHPADILGCDECLPPELDDEDLIDVFDTDPEWEAYKEGEEEEEDDDVVVTSLFEEETKAYNYSRI